MIYYSGVVLTSVAIPQVNKKKCSHQSITASIQADKRQIKSENTITDKTICYSS